MISTTIMPTGAHYACAGTRIWPDTGNGFVAAGVAVLAHDRVAPAGTQIAHTVPMSARAKFRSAKPARPPRGVPR